MKKLLGMTDYVLEQKRPIASADLHEADYYYQEYQVLENICKYANFLKQPLTLSMFIPCDENGNVLEEPNKNDTKYQTDFHLEDYFDSMAYEIDLFNYQQAKSKVIFEGFEVKERSCNDSVFKYVENGLIAVYYFNIRSKKFESNTDFKTIEDLIPYNLTLTDNVKI